MKDLRVSKAKIEVSHARLANGAHDAPHRES